MKKIFFNFVLVFLLAVTVSAKEIISEGFGDTPKLAEADALRNAVENIMGVVVDSSTMTDNNELIEDNILTHSRGYITDYKVVGTERKADGWKVIVNADVDIQPNSKLMNDLVKLGVVELSLRNPRIAVLIFEEDWKDDGVFAEAAVIKSFIDNGFEQVVNTDDLPMYKKEAWRYEVAKLRMLAAKINADILVVGKVNSDYNGDVGKYLGKRRTGMLSCKAEVNARMYSAKTGKIIASDSRIGNGLDISKEMAVNKAVGNAAKALGDVFAEKLIEEGAGNRQYLTLVAKVADFHKIDELKKALEQIGQVKSLQLRSYSDGIGTFQMRYGAEPQTLFKLLQKRAECKIVLEAADYDRLVIKAF